MNQKPNLPIWRCPLCAANFSETDKSYICSNKHCYDKAKQGYTNFAPQAKASAEYNKESFSYRRMILEEGFYNLILKQIENKLTTYPTDTLILDAGCGEGYYAQQLSPHYQLLGSDISKISIQMAAKNDKEKRVHWFVADLANMPLRDEVVDVVLNCYAPANYHTFKRILKPNGILLKVIPNQWHLQELRALTGQETYDNQKLMALFAEHFELVDCITVQETFALTANQIDAFIQMTPLLFSVDKQNQYFKDITSLTVGGTVLVGKNRQ